MTNYCSKTPKKPIVECTDPLLSMTLLGLITYPSKNSYRMISCLPLPWVWFSPPVPHSSYTKLWQEVHLHSIKYQKHQSLDCFQFPQIPDPLIWCLLLYERINSKKASVYINKQQIILHPKIGIWKTLPKPQQRVVQAMYWTCRAHVISSKSQGCSNIKKQCSIYYF